MLDHNIMLELFFKTDFIALDMSKVRKTRISYLSHLCSLHFNQKPVGRLYPLIIK